MDSTERVLAPKTPLEEHEVLVEVEEAVEEAVEDQELRWALEVIQQKDQKGALVAEVDKAYELARKAAEENHKVALLALGRAYLVCQN